MISRQRRSRFFQGRIAYHLSTFENSHADTLGRTPQPVGQPPTGATIFDSLPPSNMANYISGEGALDLKSYLTRITGAVSYGWLTQNDYVFESTTAAATATAPPTLAGKSDGLAGLGASTFTAHIAGVTRPIAPLALRYAYNAYRYGDTNNTNNHVFEYGIRSHRQPKPSDG